MLYPASILRQSSFEAMQQMPYTTTEEVVKSFDYLFRAGRPSATSNAVVAGDSQDVTVELSYRLGRPFGLSVRLLVDPAECHHGEGRLAVLHRIRVATLKFLIDDWNW